MMALPVDTERETEMSHIGQFPSIDQWTMVIGYWTINMDIAGWALEKGQGTPTSCHLHHSHVVINLLSLSLSFVDKGHGTHTSCYSQASPVELDDLRLRILLSQSNDLSKRNSSIAYTSRWIALKMCSMASPSFLNTDKVA